MYTENVEVLTYERVLGLDDENCPGEWGGNITFDWRDVKFIRTYKPDEATIKNGIYPPDCSRIYFDSDEESSFVIRMPYDAAFQKYIVTRRPKEQ